MNKIHPTAIINKTCELGENITIGPYSVLASNVKIGDGSIIHNHVTLIGKTTIGKECEVFPGAVIGGDSQDKKFDKEKIEASLEIGDQCILREHCTINKGSKKEDPRTVIGNRAWIMAGAHVAHDCRIGNDVVLSNNTALAGHVTIGNCVILSGYAAVNQFLEIGAYCMVSSRSIVKANVPPYLIVEGDHAKAMTINKVGLQRNDFTEEEINDVKKVFRMYYRDKSKLKKEALQEIKQLFSGKSKIDSFIQFIEGHELNIS